MIQFRHEQRQVWEGYFAEDAERWMEPWMKQADELLEDEALLESVYEAQGRRRPKSRRRGRKQTPAEVVLRLAVLKHLRNWSCEETEREVRANVVYRQFTRIGAETVPDAKTLGRLVQALGPEVVEQIHQRLVKMAAEKKVVRGRQLRVDTAVVETNIHYPTDSSLLGDGVRVLTRTMKRITDLAGKTGSRLRDRTRSVRRRMWEITRASHRPEERVNGEARAELSATFAGDASGGELGQTFRPRDCQRGQARRRLEKTDRLGSAAEGTGKDGAAGQAGHPPSPGAGTEG